MWSGVWNKRKLTSDISNRFPSSSVSRAWDRWSGGCEFKPQWGQFLMKFILCCVTLDLSNNLTEMRQIGLTWKTQMDICVEVLFRLHYLTICTLGQPVTHTSEWRDYQKEIIHIFLPRFAEVWSLEPIRLQSNTSYLRNEFSACLFCCGWVTVDLTFHLRIPVSKSFKQQT